MRILCCANSTSIRKDCSYVYTTLPGLSPRGRTTRRLPVNWGLADSQREQPQPEVWRRSQGNTRQHLEVLDLIVVSTVSSPMDPAAADQLVFAESQRVFNCRGAQRQRASHQNLDVANHPFSRGGRVGAENGASPSTPWPNLWMSGGRSVRILTLRPLVRERGCAP